MTKNLDRETLKELRPKIEKALSEIADEYQVQFTLGGATFTGSYATFKLQVATLDKTGEARTKESEDFKLYAKRHGLSPSDLKRYFNYAKEKYQIVGLKPKSKKFPILAKNIKNEKIYKFPASVVQTGLIREDDDDSGGMLSSPPPSSMK